MAVGLSTESDVRHEMSDEEVDSAGPGDEIAAADGDRGISWQLITGDGFRMSS